MSEDEELRQQASVNDLANLRHPFERAFTSAVIEMMSGNEHLSQCLLDDQDFREAVKGWVLPHVYEKSRAKNEEVT